MRLKAEDEASGQVAWHTLDAARPIEVIRDEIRAIADRVVVDAKAKPIGKLWL